MPTAAAPPPQSLADFFFFEKNFLLRRLKLFQANESYNFEYP
jgi:hypothetical protein